MKEKIIFKDMNGKEICEVVMPYKNEWDWISVLERLNPDQLEEVKESFLYYYKEFAGNNDWLVHEDLNDLYAFEDALVDFSCYTEDGNDFYTLEDVEETSKEQKHKHGITIRQLYKLAEAAGALDAPITATFYCEDDWYSFEDEPLTESCFNISEKAIDITM
jgi:hypothetical protein